MTNSLGTYLSNIFACVSKTMSSSMINNDLSDDYNIGNRLLGILKSQNVGTYYLGYYGVFSINKTFVN